MGAAPKLKESDLFQPVKAWLEEQGYEVYAEVRPEHHFERVDVVGVRNGIVVAVEMKTSLSFAVAGQAYDRKKYAHHVYAAVPKPKSEFDPYAIRCLKQDGIGLLSVNGEWCNQEIKPKYSRHVMPWLLNACTEYHKDTIGGTKGDHLTPYKISMMRIKEFLTESGGWHTALSILTNVKTHYYPTQGSTLENMLLTPENREWLEVRREGRSKLFRIKTTI